MTSAAIVSSLVLRDALFGRTLPDLRIRGVDFHGKALEMIRVHFRIGLFGAFSLDVSSLISYDLTRGLALPIPES